jgi:hypothetical protein
MFRNDLFILLSHLSKDEIKRLGKFVSSPYFNTNSKAARLLEALKPFHPGFDSDKLTKMYLHKELYGKADFVEGTINYLFSELQTITEKFISHENLDNGFMILNI